MKGIIFNLVEDAVTTEHGDSAWDRVLDSAGSDGVYTALGNYPCGELARLVEAGSVVLDTSPGDLSRALGQSALLGLARRYPRYFEPFDSTLPFLLTLNDVIHAEVRKLDADASPPEFWFDQSAEEMVTVHYRSRRDLCALAEGMIAGAAGYYGERLELTHTQCQLDGADHCIFTVRFSPE